MFFRCFLKSAKVWSLCALCALFGNVAFAEDAKFLSVTYSPMTTIIESIFYNSERAGREQGRVNGGDFGVKVGVSGDNHRFYIEGGFSQKYTLKNIKSSSRLGYVALGADWLNKISEGASSSTHFVLGGSVGLGLADYDNRELVSTSPTGDIYNLYTGKALGVHTNIKAGVLFNIRQFMLEAGVKAMFGTYMSHANIRASTTIPSPYSNVRIISEQVGPYMSIGVAF